MELVVGDGAFESIEEGAEALVAGGFGGGGDFGEDVGGDPGGGVGDAFVFDVVFEVGEDCGLADAGGFADFFERGALGQHFPGALFLLAGPRNFWLRSGDFRTRWCEFQRCDLNGGVGALGVVDDEGEDVVTVVGGFFEADPLDFEEFFCSGGMCSGEFAEGGVGEDDVGRDAAFLGFFAAPGAKFVEERFVNALPGIGSDLGFFAFAGSGFEEAGSEFAFENAMTRFRDLERVVFADFREVFLADELFDPVTDGLLGVGFQQSPSSEFVVAFFDDASFFGAIEDQGDVVAAVHLTEADDAGEDFLGGDEGILDEFNLSEANVAGSAVVSCEFLPEIAGERAVAADGSGGVLIDAFE